MALVFSKNNELFAIMTDRKARIFDTGSWKGSWECHLTAGPPCGICFSDDNSRITISTEDRVSIYELGASGSLMLGPSEEKRWNPLEGSSLTSDLCFKTDLGSAIAVLEVRNLDYSFRICTHSGDGSRLNISRPSALPSGHRLVD